MVRFGMENLTPLDLIKSSGWITMDHESKEYYLAQLDQKISTKKIDTNSNILANLSFSLKSLEIHHKNGGKNGTGYKSFLNGQIKLISGRGSSPVTMDTEMAKGDEKVDQKPVKEAKLTIEQQLNEIFAPKRINNRAVRLFLTRMETEPDLGKICAIMTKIATNSNTDVFTHHPTTFANIFKRLVSRLTIQKELIKLDELCPILANILTDEKISTTPGLKILRILTNDLKKKLAAKSPKDASKMSTSSVISAMAESEPEKIESKLKSTFSTVTMRDQILAICKALSTQKNDRVCGFLTDLFVEQNVNLLQVAPAEELELFFKSASRLPQLQSLFLHHARWDTIKQCIDWLLSDKSNDMDSNAVLDFLWAVERLRLLWRGRELVSDRCLQAEL